MKRTSKQRLVLDRQTVRALVVELPVDKLEPVQGAGTVTTTYTFTPNNIKTGDGT